ncbi:Shikimate O-hydroxycinnamoyltransferase [Dichanthelium oligosanthes]|uniref:Shikimate O-hydroxycinnamoyltransferase n=1 Tax=Dichanthelium oligosanthes TaxID=888268 RepID=A0A1E5W9D5_9POAL|nr:Shikimate O-hydroxycinnamoyltransferase [Dichanthelium oligosanthes]
MNNSAVKVVETCFVSPSEGTPRKQLWLSTLDNLLAYEGHTSTVYFYQPAAAAAGDFFSVARLMESMARALVPFYPLAGRLCVDGEGQLVIDTNAEGALLVVARSDKLTLEDFADLKPTPELKTLFVPRVEPSSVMLAIQVHSLVGDGAVFDPPCHDRALLRARSPPVVQPDALSVFCRQLSFAPPSGPVANEVFTISKDRLAALKRAAGGVSTFCAVSALVWQCACAARGLRRPDAEAHLALPANIRRVVKPPLPDHYFGNALIFLETVALVQDVTSESLAATASRIRRVISRMDDELARSAIDYYKLAEKDNRRPPSGCLPLARPEGPAEFEYSNLDVTFEGQALTFESLHIYYVADCSGNLVRCFSETRNTIPHVNDKEIIDKFHKVLQHCVLSSASSQGNRWL